MAARADLSHARAASLTMCFAPLRIDFSPQKMVSNRLRRCRDLDPEKPQLAVKAAVKILLQKSD
jgi:hypothetical protein